MVNRLLILLTLICFLFPRETIALDCNAFRYIGAADSLESAFRNAHKALGCNDGVCYRNAKVLAQYLVSEGHAKLEDLEVGFIYNRGDPKRTNGRNIFALDARGSIDEWFYHVFLIHGDKVLDVHFGKEPRIVDVATYMQQMYLNPTEPEKMIEGQHLFTPSAELGIRIVPATDYVNNTVTTRAGILDYRYYIYENDGKYPELSVQDFLQMF